MSSEFRPTAPSADTVFYRSYSRRKPDGNRESFKEAMTRAVNGVADVGEANPEHRKLMLEQALEQHAFPSGRAFWVAGSEWSKRPENFYGFYNCSSVHIDDLKTFGLLMDMAMQGTGTGAVLEQITIGNLPPVRNRIEFIEVFPVGAKGGNAHTNVSDLGDYCRLIVGDSRQGWVDAYQGLINAAFSEEQFDDNTVRVVLDLSNVRPAGKRLKGFGGTANPVKLEEMFRKVADLLNGCQGRHITSVEACLLIDEAASCVVAGNIRRSAGMRQFSSNDQDAIHAKEGLYSQDEEGNWRVDPKKEALRMANHTICYHHKPSLEEVKASVTKQFYSGEGAIQYVPEALARANADLLPTPYAKDKFIRLYEGYGKQAAKNFLYGMANAMRSEKLDERELEHRVTRYGLNPCAEVVMRDNLCNLGEVHLNTLDPQDHQAQYKAFYAAGLQVACLLKHRFVHERIQYSRTIDPIVGVSFTGLFDFFVTTFGTDWLEWMFNDRPEGQGFELLEQEYLQAWKRAAYDGVRDFCTEHGLRMPNRWTVVQPAGSKSLLTGASSGWHPPYAQRFIRRITLGKQDPLVSALRDWGYPIVPAPSARDEDGNLLNDINDPRVQELLVEIPTEVSWANLPGADQYDLNQLSAVAQMRLYMNVQRHYTNHTTSATIAFRENEIDALAQEIHDAIGTGYIGVALLARFDANATFPRLPMEPISKEKYDELVEAVNAWRLPEDEELGFLGVLAKYDRADYELVTESACTSAACIARAEKDEQEGKA